MNRVRHILLPLLAASLPAGAAVNVVMKDGESFLADAVAAQGNKIQISQTGQKPRLVDAGAVERIDLPEPPAMKEVTAAHLAGDTVKTLQAMGKLRAELEPFRAIAGARELWLEAEFLRGHVLLNQKRLKEVETSMREIAATGGDAEAQRHAKVFLAHLSGIGGDPKGAAAELRTIILETTDPDTLADAWLFAGHQLSASGDQHSALLAYLRLPVFYPGRVIALGAAQLGAARSYVALEDPARARAVLRDLITRLPNTTEATDGRKLLAQVERDLGLATSAEPTKETK